jgi:hypothetical protein
VGVALFELTNWVMTRLTYPPAPPFEETKQ